MWEGRGKKEEHTITGKQKVNVLLTVINMIWLNPFIKDRGFQIR